MGFGHNQIDLVPEQPLELELGTLGVGLKQGNVFLCEIGQSQVGGSLLDLLSYRGADTLLKRQISPQVILVKLVG